MAQRGKPIGKCTGDNSRLASCRLANNTPGTGKSVPDRAIRVSARRFSPSEEDGVDMVYFFAIIEIMTDRSYLGEFELMILLAVVHLGDQAYGVPISRELETHRDRAVSVGSVYAALERLESKGLVASTV